MQREQLIYTGIPTFMGGDFINEKDIKKYDIVFLGVPTDYGSGYRLGAKYAPRKLREYSFWDRVDGSEMYDLDTEKYINSKLEIGDIGDIESILQIRHNQTIIIEKVINKKRNIPFSMWR